MRLALVMLGTLTLSCRGLMGPEGCTDDMRIGLTPLRDTLLVGGSITPVLSLSACGGQKKLSDKLTWTSQDPSVATVHATRGTVSAIKVGSTVIDVEGERFGYFGGVEIMVVSPP